MSRPKWDCTDQCGNVPRNVGLHHPMRDYTTQCGTYGRIMYTHMFDKQVNNRLIFILTSNYVYNELKENVKIKW